MHRHKTIVRTWRWDVLEQVTQTVTETVAGNWAAGTCPSEDEKRGQRHAKPMVTTLDLNRKCKKTRVLYAGSARMLSDFMALHVETPHPLALIPPTTIVET